MAVATGHVCNDASKRTACRSRLACLDLNGVKRGHDTVEMGDTIHKVPPSFTDEEDLAAWLRENAVD